MARALIVGGVAATLLVAVLGVLMRPAGAQSPQTVTAPGTAAPYAVTVQGNALGTPIAISGTVSSSGAADTIGSTGALGALDARVSVALAGTAGCGLHLAAGTLAATLTPELSNDNGTTWYATKFVDTSGTATATQAFTNPNAATEIGIVVLGGARKCSVRVSSYTSGTANAFVVATISASTVAGGGTTSVNLTQVGGNSTAVGSGVVTTGTLRVTHATDVTVKTDGSAVTQPVSAASLPLPAGAATAARQDTGNTSLSSIDTKVVLPAALDGSGFLKVHEQGTATVAGTVTSNIGTTGGLCLDATVGRAQGSTTSGQTGPLVQGAVTTSAPSYTNAQTSPLSLTAAGALRVDGSAVTQPVSAASLPLPSGAATSANQSTEITSLSSIDTKVVLPAALDGSGYLKTHEQGTATVAGTVTANVGTTGGLCLDATLDNLTVAQGAALGSNTQAMVGGSVTTAAPSYTNGQISPMSLNTAGGLRVDGSGVTQPVSAASLPLPSGAATEATLATLSLAQASTTSGQKGPLIQGAVSTSAPTYTNAQTDPLSLTTAGALRVDGSAVTQPISAASLPLPAGAATAANQSTANASLSSIDTKVVLPAALDGSGYLKTHEQGTATVAGTVTANVGTTGGLALDATLDNLTIAQGAALGSNTQALVGASVTTAAPSYTNGQISPLNMNTSGGLRVDGSGVTQTVSGTVAATQSTSPWIVAGGGTAGSAATGVVTIQGIASMTPVQVSQATASNLNATVAGNLTNNNAAPGATNVGALTAVANAADPSWSEGNQALLSVSLAGALRTTDETFVDGANFTANTTNVGMVGGVYNDNLVAIDSGEGAAARITANRALHTNLRDVYGAPLGTATNPIRVDPVNGTPQPITLGSGPPLADGIWTRISDGTHGAAGVVPPNKPPSPSRDPGLVVSVREPPTWENRWNTAATCSALSSETRCYTAPGSGTLHITGFLISASAAITMQLTRGTGTNCATGNAALTPLMYMAANSGGVMVSPPQPIDIPQATDVCCKPSGASGSCFILGYTSVP